MAFGAWRRLTRHGVAAMLVVMQSMQQLKVGDRVESLVLEDGGARGSVSLVSASGNSVHVHWDDDQQSLCAVSLLKLVVPDAREHRILAAKHRQIADAAGARPGKAAFFSKWRNTQAALRHEGLAARLEESAS